MLFAKMPFLWQYMPKMHQILPQNTKTPLRFAVLYAIIIVNIIL
jgi:uncharacterized protein YqcC (DUF446 family)